MTLRFLPRFSVFALVLGAALAACTRTPAEPEPVRAEPPRRAAASPAAACSRSALTNVISMPEDVPKREDVERVCAEPRPSLIEIAKDEKERGLARLRSIELLGSFGGVDAVAALGDLATATTDLASVRRSALVAIGRATPEGHADRERVAIAALSDADPHVRRAAAELLRGSTSNAATSALDQALAREQEPFVKSALEQSRKAH